MGGQEVVAADLQPGSAMCGRAGDVRLGGG